MLKVECEACKAPYQIDERRVPPAGLKMRCAKCGHSFLVTNPGAAAVPTAATVPAMKKAEAPGGPPPAPAAMKKTMVGLAPPGASQVPAQRVAPPVNAPAPTPQAQGPGPARPP